MRLQQLSDALAICRFGPGDPVPEWAECRPDGGLISVTRTAHELSIVCPQRLVPKGLAGAVEKPWTALGVAGPLDFSLVGVLTALLDPLRDAGISVFALSTFETDYVLVRSAARDEAVRVLEAAGHDVEPPP